VPVNTTTPHIDVGVRISAPAPVILKAFFEADALGAWWQVAHSVTTPRVLGPFVVEWEPTLFRDEVLGRLGGVFRGTVVQYDPGRGFFVADAFWLPPDGEPIGPMALEVTMRAEAGGVTYVRVVQRGFEESERWRRYYDVVAHGWERALASLKSLLEH
jgi:uncharacterized protein YndB with AHSA1/START domain